MDYVERMIAFSVKKKIQQLFYLNIFVILILLNFYGSWNLLNSQQYFLGHLHFSFSQKKITKYVSDENPVTLALSFRGKWIRGNSNLRNIVHIQIIELRQSISGNFTIPAQAIALRIRI